MSVLLWVGLALGGTVWGPWQDAWAPVDGVEALPAASPASETALARMYRWYRKQSDKDGARCPYYPTCSSYGYTAVRRHGVFVGGLFTLDRLLREYRRMGEDDFYPLVTVYGTVRFHDPVPPARSHRER